MALRLAEQIGTRTAHFRSGKVHGGKDTLNGGGRCGGALPQCPRTRSCTTCRLVNGLSGGGRASPLRGLGRNGAPATIFRRALVRPLHREAK